METLKTFIVKMTNGDTYVAVAKTGNEAMHIISEREKILLEDIEVAV